MKILLATRNLAKIEDYSKILRQFGIEVVDLNSLGIQEKVEEDELTFEQNARKKALFYHKLSGLPTLADDGGFEIDYLNGEPGVKSRRWTGQEATDEELVDKLVKVISVLPTDQRTGRFTTVLCFAAAAQEIYSVKNSIKGYLTEQVNYNYPKGFSYRACFIEKTFNKYLMDLTEEEYRQINHRQKNIEEIIKHLRSYYMIQEYARH